MGYKDPPKEHQFKPGKSGNPAGKPKGSLSLVAILKEKLAEVPEGMDGKTYARLLIDRMMNVALKKGDVSMIRDILDRVDGKAVASLDLTTGGLPITLGGLFDAVEVSLEDSAEEDNG